MRKEDGRWDLVGGSRHGLKGGEEMKMRRENFYLNSAKAGNLEEEASG